MTTRKDFLRGPRVDPKPLTGRETIPELVDNAFLAYNAGRLAEGCRLFTERMLEDDVTGGMSLTGAMTPAGLGMSTIIPLIEAGFIDWIVSTRANLYHDAHFGPGRSMHPGTPFAEYVELREEGAVGFAAAARLERRRQRDVRGRVSRQDARRQERRPDHRWRQSQELRAPDRAADPGGARHQREGARLLPPDDGRPPRHGWPLRGHARRGGELGQGGPRQAAGHGGLLPRQHGRFPDPRRVRARPAKATTPEAPV